MDLQLLVVAVWATLCMCEVAWSQPLLNEACLDNFTKGKADFVLDLDDSVKTGAAFLGSADLHSSTECIQACCNTPGCNLALTQRAPGRGEDRIVSCFLINCVYEQEFACKFARREGFINYVTKDVYKNYVAQREHADGEDRPPIARAGPDVKVQPKKEVILSGIDSWDKEGINHYEWHLLNGDPSVVMQDDVSGQPDSIRLLDLEVGQYVFQLIVYDTAQQHSSATVTVTVLSEEQTEEHCLAPKKVGRCRGSFTRWWYNAENGNCEQFTYGGCKANKNNYLREEECNQACTNMPGPPGPLGRRLQPVCNGQCLATQFQCSDGCCIEAGLECDETPDCNDHSDEIACEKYDKGFKKLQTLDIPNNKARCVEFPETGGCRASFTRWFYDLETMQCLSFTFGGCGGNENNFHSQEECVHFCQGVTQNDVFGSVGSRLGGNDSLDGSTGSAQIAIAVFLGICILVVLAVIGYFVMKKRKSNTNRRRQPTPNSSPISTTEDTEHLVYNHTTKPV
ncbi:kunitz-type protease inhibitor 1 [Bombina bombina]|uniref:kunitz-type protease inhibitor 1 n=1 Tax=Bombina bombina TaxID=8345 RepID=UPI00235B288B|nr:kunitz-type protease inhibitor 1 [Bombina bombina]